jgi:hypothetical protein
MEESLEPINNILHFGWFGAGLFEFSAFLIINTGANRKLFSATLLERRARRHSRGRDQDRIFRANTKTVSSSELLRRMIPKMVKSLRDNGVKVAAKPADESPWYMVLLLNWFPMLP